MPLFWYIGENRTAVGPIMIYSLRISLPTLSKHSKAVIHRNRRGTYKRLVNSSCSYQRSNRRCSVQFGLMLASSIPIQDITACDFPCTNSTHILYYVHCGILTFVPLLWSFIVSSSLTIDMFWVESWCHIANKESNLDWKHWSVFEVTMRISYCFLAETDVAKQIAHLLKLQMYATCHLDK